MRVWDVHPGYLSEKRLLGQHVEIHAVYSVITNNKKGYAKHPETIRWKNNLDKLLKVHATTALEMELRGFKHKSPLSEDSYLSSNFNEDSYFKFIDHPSVQFSLLKGKYNDKERGRIPLPNRTSQLWANYKYSIMARGYNHYTDIKNYLSSNPDLLIIDNPEFIEEIILLLDNPVNIIGLINSLQHLWGYFKNISLVEEKRIYLKQLDENPINMVKILFDMSLKYNVTYLKESTYFSDVPVNYPPKVIS